MTEPTPSSRLDLFKQMEALLQQIDTSSFALWRHVRELWAQESGAADVPSRSGTPFERVPISPAVMAKTAAEVILNPSAMPDLRVPGTRQEFRATPASTLEPLIGAVDLGGDAVEDGEAIYEDDDGPSPEQQAAWRQWEERGPQGPIEEGSGALLVLVMKNAQRFALLANAPRCDGPIEAVRGYAECAEVLGGTGPAIEAYEALLSRTRDDDKPPPWVHDLRAKIAALRGVP